MELSLTGKIVNILPRKDRTDKNGKPFATQVFAIEVDYGRYREIASLTIFANESHPRLRNLSKYLFVGNNVRCICDIRSRLSNNGDRYFTEINCLDMAEMTETK